MTRIAAAAGLVNASGYLTLIWRFRLGPTTTVRTFELRVQAVTAQAGITAANAPVGPSRLAAFAM